MRARQQSSNPDKEEERAESQPSESKEPDPPQEQSETENAGMQDTIAETAKVPKKLRNTGKRKDGDTAELNPEQDPSAVPTSAL